MPLRSKKMNAPRMGITNKLLLFNLIRNNPMITRRTLSQLTSLDPSTVTKIVFSLLERGLVKEEGANSSKKPGRRSIALKVVKDAAISINLVFGPLRSFLGLGYLDNSYEILDEFPTVSDVSEYFSIVYKKVKDLREKLAGKNIVGLSISLPGMADQKRQVMEIIPHLHWEDVDVRALFIENDPQWQLPIFLANEAQLSFSAEISSNSQTREFNDGLYVFISEGVGGALMVNGQIYTGPSFSAGEFGHMSIDPEGEQCYCMNRGCWEVTVSVGHLVERFQRAGGNLSEEGLYEKFVEIMTRSASDSMAESVLEELVENLSRGVVNLANAFNPSFVMLGGMGEAIPDRFVERVQRLARKRALKPAARDLRVFKGTLDILSACSKGCTLLAMDAFAERLFQ